ncbi:unnamed protein product, partial [Closterium sp. NIES-54]
MQIVGLHQHTLPVSPQQNGIAERRIGMVMDVARSSVIHAAAPYFLRPFAVQYAAHQINLQPRVSLPETTPTLRWTGKVGDASAFRVWGSRAFVRDTTADKLSSRGVPCVFLGFPPDAPGWQFYHPTSRRGPAPSGVSQVDPAKPVEVAVDSGAARGADPAGAGTGGVETGGGESGVAETGGAESGGEAMVVVLERQLHAVKINEGDAVQGAFDQLRDLYVKLSAAGVDYREKIKCYKALSLLPESWGPLVVNLNGMKDSWSLEPGQPSIEGSKGVHGAMGEGMGSEEGDGGAGGHGGMFYHVGEACSEVMVVPASKVSLHRSSHWVIDTKAFMTMTNREDLLDEVRPSKAATVVSATGQVVPVRGEGRAMFMGADGRLVGLKRVLLVPGLYANLLSTKALSEAGMKIEMMGTKVFKATLDGRVLWDLRGGKDMHRSMWEIPVLPWKEAAARLAAEAVRGGHASHVTSGGGGDGSDGGLLVHGGGALPSVTPSTELSGLYPELVGCLMYLMTCTRPDLAYPLSLLARYVAPGRHRKVHWDAAKRVLRYLCSTSGMGLVLGGRARVVLTGHADASWVDDLATQRSSQGYTFSLGSGSVSWQSTRCSSVLRSSCEAEIYTGAMAAQELRWLTYLLTDLGEAPRSPPVLYVDNKAMLALCQEHRLEHRTKHIALRYFLARELQQRGQLRLAYVASEANTAEVFTKALQP